MLTFLAENAYCLADSLTWNVYGIRISVFKNFNLLHSFYRSPTEAQKPDTVTPLVSPKRDLRKSHISLMTGELFSPILFIIYQNVEIEKVLTI